MTLMSVKQNVDKLLCTNYPWFKPQLYKENSRRSRRLVKSNPLQKYYYLLKNMFVCLRIVKEISLNEIRCYTLDRQKKQTQCRRGNFLYCT